MKPVHETIPDRIRRVCGPARRLVPLPPPALRPLSIFLCVAGFSIICLAVAAVIIGWAANYAQLLRTLGSPP